MNSISVLSLNSKTLSTSSVFSEAMHPDLPGFPDPRSLFLGRLCIHVAGSLDRVECSSLDGVDLSISHRIMDFEILIAWLLPLWKTSLYRRMCSREEPIAIGPLVPRFLPRPFVPNQLVQPLAVRSPLRLSHLSFRVEVASLRLVHPDSSLAEEDLRSLTPHPSVNSLTR